MIGFAVGMGRMRPPGRAPGGWREVLGTTSGRPRATAEQTIETAAAFRFTGEGGFSDSDRLPERPWTIQRTTSEGRSPGRGPATRGAGDDPGCRRAAARPGRRRTAPGLAPRPRIGRR